MGLISLSNREKVYFEANKRIHDYLQEKQAIGFVSGVMMQHKDTIPDLVFRHQFAALPEYFDRVLCVGLAQMCCTGGIVPLVYGDLYTSSWKPAVWRGWAIWFRPRDSMLTEEHVPLITEHLRSVRGVVWQPPGLKEV